MSDLTDYEIDNICAGLTQNAAKVKFLKRMGLVVRQKPNGRPLVCRSHYEMTTSGRRDFGICEPNWSIA